MNKKLLPFLSLLLALTMILVMAGSVYAHIAPLNANSNNLSIGINRPALVYYIGDTVHYTVTVSVPLHPAGGAIPCLQTGMSTYFTDPADLVAPAAHPEIHTIDFPLIPELLPGESVSFNSTVTTSTIYSPQGGDPTRAQLIAGTHAMPVNPTFISSTTVYPGGTPIVISSFPALDYVIDSADYAGNPNLIAFAHTGNTNGVHANFGTNDSAAADASISIFVYAPNTAVTIIAADSIVMTDNSTLLTVTESNTGNLALTAVHVVIDNGVSNIADLNVLSAGFSSSGNADSTLDVGETWTWTGVDTGLLTETTVFTATGHGTAPGGLDITYPAYAGEQASTIVRVDTPTPPVPELPAGVLLGLGLLGIVGYVGIKRHKGVFTEK